MHSSSQRLLAGPAILWAGSLLILSAPLARAQDVSIGSVGVASGISSSMSGIGAGSSTAAMRQARGVGGPGGPGAMDGDGPAGMGEGGPGRPGMPDGGATAGGDTATVAPGGGGAPAAPDVPLRWYDMTGEQMINELLAGGRRAPVRRSTTRRTTTRRSSRQQARYSRRVNSMTAAQRKRLVLAKYQVPPRGWLSHYLKEDRYKVTSGVWKFVTTPNDPYYYVPSAPAMMRKPAAQIIGFYSWQDATAAGYRPDPATKPAPGAQLAQLARLSRGPMLARYIEYVYNGQVRPDVFQYNYNYTMRVANEVLRHRHTRPHVSETVNQVIGATIGRGSVPQFVGANGPTAGVAPATVTTTTTTTIPSPNMPAPGNTGGDRRVDEFDAQKRRFGNVSATSRP